MKKVIILIITSVISMIMLFMALNSFKTIDTNYDELRPLEIRKSDIYMQLDSLEREYSLKMNGKALSFLLFSDFNTEYFDEVTNLLDKYGYYGTLILSKDCFPSKNGYLSIKQFNTLIKKGWNYCILYDNPEQFDYLHKLFEVNGMKTDTVYFNKGKYNLGLDDSLIALGYKSVIHHGEYNLNLYKDTVNNVLWHVGNMGLVGSSPKAKLLDTIEVHGAFSYTISFDKNNKEEFYNYDTLNLVIDNFNTLVNKDALRITDLERGLKYKQEIQKEYTKNKEEYENIKNKLNQELKEIEKQIEVLERG